MDEILSSAGIFQGVEPNAASALTSQLQPADFPRGHTVFAQGEPPAPRALKPPRHPTLRMTTDI
ncbi:MAG: family transcriptional regulator, cyclic receptor protein [Mycobacterium sp.]|nr:family transcriptional regulator, cyclic receptor protein [Mycobacterium sp.]